jgi:hypothetical protein
LSLVEQAAEHFVRGDLGLTGLDDVTSLRSLGGGRVEVDVAGAGTVTVTVARDSLLSPTPLTCKGAEGLSYPVFRGRSGDR